MYIFYHSIHMMVVNSWLMDRKDAKALNEKKPMKLAVFQSRLATQLVAPSAPVGRPKLPAIGSPKMNTVFHRVPPKKSHLDGKDHLPDYSNTRGRCKGQNCKRLSFIKCAKCMVYLCLNKDRNCFSRFHM